MSITANSVLPGLYSSHFPEIYYHNTVTVSGKYSLAFWNVNASTLLDASRTPRIGVWRGVDIFVEPIQFTTLTGQEGDFSLTVDGANFSTETYTIGLYIALQNSGYNYIFATSTINAEKFTNHLVTTVSVTEQATDKTGSYLNIQYRRLPNNVMLSGYESVSLFDGDTLISYYPVRRCANTSIPATLDFMLLQTTEMVQMRTDAELVPGQIYTLVFTLIGDIRYTSANHTFYWSPYNLERLIA
ncbi:MAG: hypothetical protein P4M00_00430 [Azospirillaceae bacterium]|nr:hypothetical protein [Azospirillaceae bacterium]